MKSIQVYWYVLFSSLLTYFESTQSFMTALFIGFLFNIFAGFKSDEVKIKMGRLCNFSGNKFKDSLMELFLITLIIYLLKGIADLMNYRDKGVYVVELLVWIALYNYIRNGLKNLSHAYPKNVWIKFVHAFISLNFKKLAPEEVLKALEEAENEKSNENKKEDK